DPSYPPARRLESAWIARCVPRGPADGRVWHGAGRGAIVGHRYRDRPVRAILASNQPLSPLTESSAMITRSLIVVCGLVSMTVAGRLVARGQEPTARDEGAPRRSATETSYKDWHGAGPKGAVAAGGRDAVLAGIEILNRGGNAADAGAATILSLSVTDS